VKNLIGAIGLLQRVTVWPCANLGPLPIVGVAVGRACSRSPHFHKGAPAESQRAFRLS